MAQETAHRRAIDDYIELRKHELLGTVVGGQIRRQDQWRLDYLELPYLRDCPLSEVITRFNDVQANLCTITETGQLGIGAPGNSNHFWMSRWTHLLEEFGLRGGMPAGLKNPPHFPVVTHPNLPKGAEIIRKRPIKKQPHLIKLARRDHAESMFGRGVFQISPASSYSNPDYAAATRDNEVSFWLSIAAGEKLNERIGDSEPTAFDGRVAASREVLRLECKDYYALCMTDRYDFRLLDDFGYDSFIVVYDIAEFAKRLKRSVLAIHPKARMVTRDVVYLDPYYCATWQLVPRFSKNIRYAYQHEWRFVWWMPDGEALGTFFVELGSLDGVAELYTL